jgi:hypothetical protein
MSDPPRLTDEQQLSYMVNAIAELMNVVRDRERSWADAAENKERAEHLRHIAAAAGSMRSATWSLTNLAMTLAEQTANRR